MSSNDNQITELLKNFINSVAENFTIGFISMQMITTCQNKKEQNAALKNVFHALTSFKNLSSIAHWEQGEHNDHCLFFELTNDF